MLTKLVNENRTNWDEHLSTMLFSYRIAYKVATKVHTISISVWIASIDSHIIHSANCWCQLEKQYFNESFD
jgi:hypothetical protein